MHDRKARLKAELRNANIVTPLGNKSEGLVDSVLRRCGVGDIKKENSTMFQSIRMLAVTALLALIAFGSTPKVGDRVPQFSLPASDGRTVALKDYSGKKLVLVFYRGYW